LVVLLEIVMGRKQVKVLLGKSKKGDADKNLKSKIKKIELEDAKQSIEIRLSRLKIFLVIIGSFLFVLIGVSFINDPQGWNRNPAVVYVTGIACICFFGMCLLYGLYKITDTNVGLRLDSEGLYDNSNAASLGLIRWQDITGIETVEVASNKALVISISNDEKYINNGSNFFVKRLAKMNKKWYGSPVVISAVGLKTDFDSLKSLVRRSWRRFK